MATTMTHRHTRNELAQRLITEYTGALPAGRVLAVVLRTDLLLASYRHSQRLVICEELARHRLSELATCAPAGGTP